MASFDAQSQSQSQALGPTDDHKQLGLSPTASAVVQTTPKWFSISICHIVGKYLYTADTLSHASVSHPDAVEALEDHLTECFINNVVASCLPLLTCFTAIILPREKALPANNCSPYTKMDGLLIGNKYQSTFYDFGLCRDSGQ